MRIAHPLAALAAAAIAFAATPAGAQNDPRLQVLHYVPGAVFTLRVAPGYVATVILGDDERIESLAVGNAAAWEVTPSKSGDHLFVKPLATGVSTNVEVVTDQRHYSFLLQSTFDGDPQAAFQLRFDYAGLLPAGPGPLPGAPSPNVPAAAVQEDAVGRYRLSGAREIRPVSMDDNGVRTQFVFADAASLPAIYAVDEHGNETLVTTRHAGDVLIVDRVWRRYVFRRGHATAGAQRIAPRADRVRR